MLKRSDTWHLEPLLPIDPNPLLVPRPVGSLECPHPGLAVPHHLTREKAPSYDMVVDAGVEVEVAHHATKAEITIADEKMKRKLM